jgi:hypothetical protein
MKQVSIAKLYGCNKQNINNKLRRKKKNEDKKPNIRQQVKLPGGSIGRTIIQPLLHTPSKNNDENVLQGAGDNQRQGNS